MNFSWLRPRGKKKPALSRHGVERVLERNLREEGERAVPRPPGEGEPRPDGVSNAEISVLVEVTSTLAVEDTLRSADLLKRQHALITATHKSDLAWHRLRELGGAAAWTGHPPLPEAGEAVAGPRRFRERFDPHPPLITAKALLVVEIALIVVECLFWYNMFTETVSRSIGIWSMERVGAVLLALLIPVGGVAIARVMGPLGHRLVMQYPDGGRRERWGSAIALGAFVLVVGAVFWLVHFRFAEAALGASELPAVPMAAVFALVLVGDMIARVFLVSEIRAQSDKRAKEFENRVKDLLAAHGDHAKEWESLQSVVQDALNRAERIVAVGARLISDHRSRSGGDDLRSEIVLPRQAHRLVSGGASEAVPSWVPDSTQLSMFGVPLALGPIRRVEDCNRTLHEWCPRPKSAVDEMIDELREGLAVPLVRTPPAETPRPVGVVQPVEPESAPGPESAKPPASEQRTAGSPTDQSPSRMPNLSEMRPVPPRSIPTTSGNGSRPAVDPDPDTTR